MIRRLVKVVSQWSRSRRAEIFIRDLRPTAQDRILDLGASDGSHVAGVTAHRLNVYIADINRAALRAGRKRFGFQAVLVDETDGLPFRDNAFDIVFCSSVIEHATGEKENVMRFRTNREFREAAFENQRRFAAEIQRVSKRYFIQTPSKYFPIESHTWLPVFIVFLPRQWQVALIRFLNRRWPKKTTPDWNLLTKEEMRRLFPDADIVVERVFGCAKSIMAIKR
jgi:hypothetical protein